MADIPAGYVALDLVGFTDRGPYVAGATYMINDLVHVNNAIWRCKVDNTSGIAPAENANWAIYIQSSTDLAGIMAVDTGGVLGAAGQVVVSQELISAITNMVMKELVKKTHIVNNLLATDTSTVLAGPMGKQLAEKDAELQKQINDTNSNLGVQAPWSLEEVNSLRPSFAVGTIPPATAVSIGISNAVDHMIVLHIPWTGPYPAQLLITAAGRKEMYLRHCINGTWETPQKILTNADIIYANSLAGLVSKMSNLQAYRTYTLFADGVLGNELTGVTASCTGVISKLSGTMYDIMISHSAGAYIYTVRIQNGIVLDRRRIATTQVK